MRKGGNEGVSERASELLAFRAAVYTKLCGRPESHSGYFLFISELFTLWRKLCLISTGGMKAHHRFPLQCGRNLSWSRGPTPPLPRHAASLLKCIYKAAGDRRRRRELGAKFSSYFPKRSTIVGTTSSFHLFFFNKKKTAHL